MAHKLSSCLGYAFRLAKKVGADEQVCQHLGAAIHSLRRDRRQDPPVVFVAQTHPRSVCLMDCFDGQDPTNHHENLSRRVSELSSKLAGLQQEFQTQLSNFREQQTLHLADLNALRAQQSRVRQDCQQLTGALQNTPAKLHDEVAPQIAQQVSTHVLAALHSQQVVGKQSHCCPEPLRAARRTEESESYEPDVAMSDHGPAGIPDVQMHGCDSSRVNDSSAYW